MLEINLDDREIIATLKSKGEVFATVYSPNLETHMKVEAIMRSLSEQDIKAQEKSIVNVCELLEIPYEKLPAKMILEIISKALEIKKN